VLVVAHTPTPFCASGQARIYGAIEVHNRIALNTAGAECQALEWFQRRAEV